MALTITYMSDLSRVRVAFTGAPAGTDYATIERSTDGITYTVIRGGAAVPVVASAGFADDYEFVASVLNTYRVSYVDRDQVPVVNPTYGALVTGNNAALNPPPPASGMAVGDLKVILATIRNSGAGTVAGATGGTGAWTKIAEFGNVALIAKRHVAGDPTPNVTFSGGVANADTTARMISISKTQDFIAGAPYSQLNSVAAQDIAGQAGFQVGQSLMMAVAWKQDDFTSSTTPSFAVKIADDVSTAGDDSGVAWFYWSIPPGNDGLGANPWPILITGGAVAISRSMLFFIKPPANVGQETGTITPTLTSIWLKNVGRPSLNLPVTVTDISEIEQPARIGLHQIIGRSKEVGTTDLRLGRRFTLTVMLPTLDAARDFENRIALGNQVFLHAPSLTACAIPTVYAVIDTTRRIPPSRSKRSQRRYFELPMVEVAAAGNTVYANTYTFNDLLADYTTFNAVLADPLNPTFSSLIDKVSNNEVVVP